MNRGFTKEKFHLIFQNIKSFYQALYLTNLYLIYFQITVQKNMQRRINLNCDLYTYYF